MVGNLPVKKKRQQCDTQNQQQDSFGGFICPGQPPGRHGNRTPTPFPTSPTGLPTLPPVGGTPTPTPTPTPTSTSSPPGKGNG
jgi:hypothetical protein